MWIAHARNPRVLSRHLAISTNYAIARNFSTSFRLRELRFPYVELEPVTYMQLGSLSMALTTFSQAKLWPRKSLCKIRWLSSMEMK